MKKLPEAASGRTTYSFGPNGNDPFPLAQRRQNHDHLQVRGRSDYHCDRGERHTNGRTTDTFDNSGSRTIIENLAGVEPQPSIDYESRDVRVHRPPGITNMMAYAPDGLRVLLQGSVV